MQFKKHIAVLLTFLLLVSNLGLAFNVHYCDDEIASISLSSTPNFQEIEKDCCGAIEKESKCCDNKIIKSEQKADQVIEKSFSFSVDALFLIEEPTNCYFFYQSNFQKHQLTAYYCDGHAPPLYQLYSQYIFYA